MRERHITVYTIGHSTRSLEEFLRLLKTNGVTRVVDIRTIPRSRHNHQFNADSLPSALNEAGIGYTHLVDLGVCATRDRTRQTPAGGTILSGATPTTCKRRSSPAA